MILESKPEAAVRVVVDAKHLHWVLLLLSLIHLLQLLYKRWLGHWM